MSTIDSTGKPQRKIIGRLIIDYDGENVLVAGPVADKVLCLGMLGLAQNAIANGNPVQVHQDIPGSAKPPINILH